MNWTHRKRIIVVAVGLSLCIQLILIGMGFINAGRIERDIDASSKEKLLNFASYNITTYFNHIYSMLNYLQSSELTEYVQSFVEFETPTVIAQKTELINSLIKQIHLSDHLVDTVYILGNFAYQKNIVIHEGSNFKPHERSPSINDLQAANLLPILNFNSNRPTVFAAGELTGRIKPSATMLPDQLANVRKLAQDLEGQILLTGGLTGSSPKSHIVIVVLKKDLLASLVKTDNSTSFALFDQNKKLLDRTAPLLGDNVVTQMKEINSSGLKIELFASREKMSISTHRKALYLKYGQFFVINLAIVFIIVFYYSYYLMLPFRRISHRMTKQHLLFPMEYLNKHKIRNGVLPSLSFRNKLFILFFLSVCIPAVSSGRLYYQFINQFTEQQIRPHVKQLSEQVNLNIRRQVIIYEDLIDKLTLNHTFVDFLTTQTYDFRNSNRNVIPDISFLQYFGISDVSYIILYNSLGSVAYSNQLFPVPNLSKDKSADSSLIALRTSIREGLGQSGKSTWVLGEVDLYNQPAVSLINRIFNPTGQNQIIGYIQIVFNEKAFQSILPENSDYLLTMNSAGGILFQNNMAKKATNLLKYLVSEANHSEDPLLSVNTSGVNGFATVSNVEGMDWRAFFVDSLEPVITKREELFHNYLIVMFSGALVTLIFAFGLTRWLLRSLEFLKSGMEQQMLEPEKEKRIVFKEQDEIGVLIDNYNRMMEKVNQLMVENIRIIEENSQNQMKQQELLSLNAQIELKMLQLQINPHFLYNTLQSIGMRAKGGGGDEVGYMVYALADLFRYSISRHEGTVSLSEEIQHTKNYIAIQEFRFKNRFKVEWKVSDEAVAWKLPKFILQPLVENALSHGILNSIREGTIWISASVNLNALNLVIQDNGVGIEPKQLSTIMEHWKNGNLHGSTKSDPIQIGGLGLNNVYFRLQFIYKGLSSVEISSEKFVGTRIELFIPQCEDNDRKDVNSLIL